jgi:hypothetical protein
MEKKYESHRHIEDVTQVEISAAIRDLDPDLRSTNEQDHATSVAICIALVLLAFACLVFIWLYP